MNREIQAQVVEAHRRHVAALVRRLVPPGHTEEGEQVGAIGVLVALEKYGPIAGHFWLFASPYVRDEIQRWLDFRRGDTSSPPLPDAELRARLESFLSTLSEADWALLLCGVRSRRPLV